MAAHFLFLQLLFGHRAVHLSLLWCLNLPKPLTEVNSSCTGSLTLTTLPRSVPPTLVDPQCSPL
jgi:hypothetical protein